MWIIIVITGIFCRLYINEARMKLTAVLDHLQGVKLRPYSQLKSDLQELTTLYRSGKIWISEQSSHSLVQVVPKSQLRSSASPIQVLKAVKNETEIQGMRACQVMCTCNFDTFHLWM